MSPLVVTGSLVIPPTELRVAAVRSSGPGGQNVNKVSSKVELRFDFEHSSVLREDTRQRLRDLAKGRLDTDGQLLIVSQATRDKQRNLEDAREKLADLVRRAMHRPKARYKTRPSRGAVETRLSEKRRQASRKKQRTSGSFE